MGRTEKIDQDLAREVQAVKVRAQYSQDWLRIKDRLKNYCNVERRTWGAALIVLLERALDEWEKIKE